MVESNQWLQEEYTIDTPENVSFGFEIAGIGSRFVGAVIDAIVLGIVLIFLNTLLGFLLELVGTNGIADPFLSSDQETSWVVGIVLAIYVLLNFLLITGYFIIFELIWNGQTVGKRAAQIRVIRVNGNPAGFLEIVVRNLVRMVDFLPMAYGVGLVTMFFNNHSRRLGDFAAGTIVIKEQNSLSLNSLGQSTQTLTQRSPSESEIAAWRERYPLLRQLTAGDYELIRETLRRQDQGKVDPIMLSRLARGIARKCGASEPASDWQSSRHFLFNAAEAYRHLVE